MTAVGKTNYSSQVNTLFERQLSNWPTVTRNYDALSRVSTRTLSVGGSKIVLQFNPERIRSSAASVDKASLKARKCFLCCENQPAEQERIMWHDVYKIQVNPYPIFPRHLTIASTTHTPQLIAGRIGHMLDLAFDLPDYVLFYNGPKCGASAPDHMHFQAGNKGFMPIIDEVAKATCRTVLTQGSCTLSLVDCLARRLFLITAREVADAQAVFEALQRVMPVGDGEQEPMQNLLCWHDGSQYHIMVFPRVRHRPSCYGSGERQFTLSPASVDMGGVIAVPVERDFRNLTAAIVQSIFDELCAGEAYVNEVISKLNHCQD